MSATVTALAVVEAAGTATVAGLAPTSIAVGAGLLALLSRAVTAQHGRPATIVLFFSLASAGALLGAAGASRGSVSLLLVGCVLLGGGSVAALATRFGAAELVEREHATTVVGLVMWFSTAGVVAGPLLAAGVSTRMRSDDQAGAFVAMSLVNACAALVIALQARQQPTGRENGERLDAPATATGRRGDGLSRQAGADDPSPGGPEGDRGHARDARWAVLVAACAHACMTALMSMAPVHLDHHGSSGGAIGSMISLHLAGMYALSPLFGLLARKWGPRRTQLVGLTTLAAASAILTTTAGTGLFAVGLALLGLGWSCCIVGASAATAAPDLGERHRSSVRSRMDSGMLLGAAATAPLVGLGAASWGYSGIAAGTAGALMILVIVTVGRRTTSRPSRTALDG